MPVLGTSSSTLCANLLRTFLFARRSSTANIVAHIARCAPEELTADHAKLEAYKKPAIAWMNKTPATGSSEGGAMSSFMAFSSLDIGMELAFLCLRDMRPFRIVECDGFKMFMSLVVPRLRLCSADIVARSAVLIDEALQLILTREYLPRSLGHSGLEDVTIPAATPFTLYSGTTDTWTARRGTPYLGATIHFITPDWEMKDLTLALRHFQPPHTAVAYEILFGALLEENGLVEGNLLTCSTDSASTMILFAELSQHVHTRCIGHSLHNGITSDTFDKSKILEAPTSWPSSFPPSPPRAIRSPQTQRRR